MWRKGSSNRPYTTKGDRLFETKARARQALAIGLDQKDYSEWFLANRFLFERVQALHQPALATGGVVLMNYALFSGLIQGADRIQGSLAGGFDIPTVQEQARFLDGCAGAARNVTVANPAFFILPVALDLRLDISQFIPPKNYSKRPHFEQQALLKGTEPVPKLRGYSSSSKAQFYMNKQKLSR